MKTEEKAKAIVSKCRLGWSSIESSEMAYSLVENVGEEIISAVFDEMNESCGFKEARKVFERSCSYDDLSVEV